MARSTKASDSAKAATDRAPSGSRRASIEHLPAQPILPAYRQVAAQLRELILGGEFPPGARLPVEEDLGALYGVSRSTVREALRELASHNLIVTTRGAMGGSFIVQPDPRAVAEWLEGNLNLLRGADAISPDEILEARVLLEAPAARLAAERRTDADLEAMHAIMDRVEAGMARPETPVSAEEFHTAVLAAAHNRLVDLVTRPTFGLLHRHAVPADASARSRRKVIAEHRRILEAIEAGDGTAAEMAMSTHLGGLRRVYQRS